MKRRLALLTVLLLAQASAAPVQHAPDPWSVLRGGGIVLFRHANAPGGGDPPTMTLGDCSSQRNLDDAGREQARRMGERLRQERVKVGAVWTSLWCRSRDTAELMAVGPVRDEPAFNSFLGDRRAEPVQTAAARELLLGWRGPGALVVTSHQLNIMALTGVAPASGEGVVLRRDGTQLKVMGQVLP